MKNLTETSDNLEKQRLKLLRFSLIGFTLWYTSSIVQRYWQSALSPTLITMLLVCFFFGIIIWCWVFMTMFKKGKSLRQNKLLTQMLSDELFEKNRDKAFKLGFITIVVIQSLFLLITTIGIDMSGGLVAELNILIAVIAFQGSFIFYHGRE